MAMTSSPLIKRSPFDSAGRSFLYQPVKRRSSQKIRPPAIRCSTLLRSWQTACNSLALTSSISPTTICSTSTQRDCKAPLSLMQEHFEPQGAVIGVNGAVPVVERNSIRFGFAAFTQHTNGIPLPQDKQEMITYTDQTERMHQQIEQLEQTADLTVVSVHWGEENSTTPTDYQRELAQQLTEWGADLIIGTHPHVLQPVEEITSPNGNRATVLYSLGNFISAQADRANLVGAIAKSRWRRTPPPKKSPFTRRSCSRSSPAIRAGMRNCTCFPLRLQRGACRPTRAAALPRLHPPAGFLGRRPCLFSRRRFGLNNADKILMVFSDPLEQENFPFQWVFLYLSQRFSGFHQASLRKNIQIASCIYTMEYDMLEKNKASHQYMLCFRIFFRTEGRFFSWN